MVDTMSCSIQTHPHPKQVAMKAMEAEAIKAASGARHECPAMKAMKAMKAKYMHAQWL